MASDTATEQPQQNSEPVKEEVETKEEAKTATEAEAPAKEDGKEAKEEKPEKEEKKKKEKPAKKEKEPKEPAPPKPTVHKVDYQEGVVYLYQFTRTPVIPSCSPFCLKVETWLRINQIKYEVSGSFEVLKAKSPFHLNLMRHDSVLNQETDSMD
jgi:hypothetical protein